ncbi:MAG: hypothetical protein JNG89_00710 [Planctomycetaceae bacterium]|nr:hypothetical protein [Planctomycetaceae bacterium]
MIRTNFIQVFALGLVVTALGMGAAAGVYSSVQGSAAQVPVKAAVQTSEPQAVQVAQADGDSFASRLRSHRIRLSADGFLPGKINLVDNETGAIRVLRDLKVLFIQDGVVKATVTPGEGGVFQASIAPGMYSLAAIGPEGYVAYGLEVLPAAAPAPGLPAVPAGGDTASNLGIVETQPVFFQEVGSVLEIDSLAIPRRDFDAVVQLARSYIPAEILNAESPGDVAGLASEGESLDEAPPTDDTPANTVMRHHEVMIGADGTLSGRTRRVHPQTGRPTRLRRLNVFLVQNNEVVSQSPVSENGTFTFSSVAPGTYSFVAAGLEGFTAFSLRAVSGQNVSDNAVDELIIPVAFQGGAMYLLDGVLVSPENLAAALKELLLVQNKMTAEELANLEGQFNGNLGTPGNGFGGGGGGMGGGGDGLLGALLGAALGAGVAALSDDGNEINRQTPTTPTP